MVHMIQRIRGSRCGMDTSASFGRTAVHGGFAPSCTSADKGPKGRYSEACGENKRK